MNEAYNTDIALFEGLAAGDSKAVREVYKQYRPMLYKWIVSRGGNEIDVDDVFQEVLIVIYDKAKLPEFCLTCKLSTYLFAISKRIWYKKLEGNKRYVFNDNNDEGGEEPHEAINYDNDLSIHEEKEEQYKQLLNALDKLGEPCSSLLKAFYMNDKSMQDIATQFNYTNAENAKTQKYKCMMRLKKIFFENNKDAILYQ